MHLAQIRGVLSISTINLNCMISEYVRNGRINDARKLFDQHPESRDIVSWNSMINGYTRNHQIQDAKKLFDKMPKRDVISWNTMLVGFQRINDPENLIGYFIQMGRIGFKPTEFTLSTAISAISDTNFSFLIPQFHACVLHLALDSSVFVGSALMRGYTNLGCRVGLLQVFDEISVKDVTSWNALILGYMNLGCVTEGREAFETMPERNIVSWTTLVGGYISNNKLDEARFHFDRMHEKNVISWTVMISGYEQNDQFIDALELFVMMWKSGVQPNQFTLSSIVSACAGSSSLLFGKQVHSNILKSGVLVDAILLSSLVDMYAKCGDINEAVKVFESISKKNLGCWNSIIGGYAIHGYGTKALEEFERMKKIGFKPDYITLVNVLAACARGGLVEEGEMYFESMESKYGIQAGKEHYACMVDLFGRAGHLEKAEKLIRIIPFEPDVVVWGALLGACGLHSSLEFGLFAAKELYKLEQDHPAVYSMLSKIHGDKGVWTKVTELRTMMKDMGAKKQKAGSWIESSFNIT